MDQHGLGLLRDNLQPGHHVVVQELDAVEDCHPAGQRLFQAERAGGGAAPGSPFGGGGSWNVNTGGAQGGYRTMTPEEMHELFGDEDPFSDFFRTFFSGGGEPERGRRGTRTNRAPRPQEGRDVEHPTPARV